MRPPIELGQIRGVFALPPTPSAPNASDFGFAVDLGEAERATRELIRSSLAGSIPRPLDTARLSAIVRGAAFREGVGS